MLEKAGAMINQGAAPYASSYSLISYHSPSSTYSGVRSDQADATAGGDVETSATPAQSTDGRPVSTMYDLDASIAESILPDEDQVRVR